MRLDVCRYPGLDRRLEGLARCVRMSTVVSPPPTYLLFAARSRVHMHNLGDGDRCTGHIAEPGCRDVELVACAERVAPHGTTDFAPRRNVAIGLNCPEGPRLERERECEYLKATSRYSRSSR